MRKEFARQLYALMSTDDKIVVITADMGYGLFDLIKSSYPERFYNPGAAEQVAMAMAVGLAMSGKIPIVYSITPFLLFRPFEIIRNYINAEVIPVILVGSGRGDDYHAGISHNASDHEILKNFKNIEFIVPEKEFNLSEIIYSGKPTYLNLKR